MRRHPWVATLAFVSAPFGLLWGLSEASDSDQWRTGECVRLVEKMGGISSRLVNPYFCERFPDATYPSGLNVYGWVTEGDDD